MSFGTPRLVKQEYRRQKGVFTGTKVYHLDGDNLATDNAMTAESAAGLPAIGQVFGTGSTAKCIGRSVRNVGDDPLTFEITCDYSSESSHQEQTIENPLARPAKFSYGDSSAEEPYFRDTDDLPATNSAGEPFETDPARERNTGTITITRNVATFSDSTAESKRNKVNSSSVTLNGVSYPERTLRITSWTGDGPNEENGVTFWVETITIAKRLPSWDDTFEDRGLNELDEGELTPILDKAGNPVIAPYPLDGSGGAKAASTDAPAIITRKPYFDTSFASL